MTESHPNPTFSLETLCSYPFSGQLLTNSYFWCSDVDAGPKEEKCGLSSQAHLALPLARCVSLGKTSPLQPPYLRHGNNQNHRCYSRDYYLVNYGSSHVHRTYCTPRTIQSHLYTLTQCSSQFYEVGPTIMPIIQKTKLRHRELMWPVHGHLLVSSETRMWTQLTSPGSVLITAMHSWLSVGAQASISTFLKWGPLLMPSRIAWDTVDR